MDDEADDEFAALEELRGFAGLPAQLEELAERAASAGLLRAPFDRAMALTFQDEQWSSLSSGMNAPARVPLEFSQFSNHSATFFGHLNRELLKVLGPPP